MSTLSQNIVADLEAFFPENASEPIFVLTDTNTAAHCLPLLQRGRLAQAQVITIPSGDEHKTLDTLAQVWTALVECGATRHSLLVNVGGGVVTDLGGLAAATFKRGIRFVNVPTTLLGAIDAATGGKTGINICGLKNEIGLFASAEAVLIDTRFFRTLDRQNLLSGFAEMLKHALISDETLLRETLAFDLDKFPDEELNTLINKNLAIKEKIIASDPTECGIRKALNFGHTFGHAFETLSHTTNRPLLHGYAVMWGMVCALYLSCQKFNFPKAILTEILYFAKENYGAFPFDCKQYDTLLALMHHDKKNRAQTINFTLLAGVGEVRIDQTADKNDIFAALDFVREN